MSLPVKKIHLNLIIVDIVIIIVIIIDSWLKTVTVLYEQPLTERFEELVFNDLEAQNCRYKFHSRLQATVVQRSRQGLSSSTNSNHMGKVKLVFPKPGKSKDSGA